MLNLKEEDVVVVTNNYMIETLDNYYTILSYIGNYPYKEVFKMIVLSFVNDLEQNCVVEKLPKSDQDKLYWLISCIKGSDCIFPTNCSSSYVTVFNY